MMSLSRLKTSSRTMGRDNDARPFSRLHLVSTVLAQSQSLVLVWIYISAARIMGILTRGLGNMTM